MTFISRRRLFSFMAGRVEKLLLSCFSNPHIRSFVRIHLLTPRGEVGGGEEEGLPGPGDVKGGEEKFSINRARKGEGQEEAWLDESFQSGKISHTNYR